MTGPEMAKLHAEEVEDQEGEQVSDMPLKEIVRKYEQLKKLE